MDHQNLSYVSTVTFLEGSRLGRTVAHATREVLAPPAWNAVPRPRKSVLGQLRGTDTNPGVVGPLLPEKCKHLLKTTQNFRFRRWATSFL